MRCVNSVTQFLLKKKLKNPKWVLCSKWTQHPTPDTSVRKFWRFQRNRNKRKENTHLFDLEGEVL